MESKILVIDNNKFYWDANNMCLIPYELMSTQSISPIKSNKSHQTTESDDEWYINNYDIEFWENILSRKLDFEEKSLFNQIWNENALNIDIKMLQKNIIQNKCYIKSITTNQGNCLFESLGALNLGENEFNILPNVMIRKNLAALLISVKTEIGFFPNLPNSTPEEIFLNYNEIEFIKDSKTGMVYEYDYDMMVYDLFTNYSWSRLPTEFLLMVISRIYNVKILIYHNKTNYINEINVWNTVDFENNVIRLGLINEEHYLPLLKLSDDLKHDKNIIDEILNVEIKYDDGIKKFNLWSKTMINTLNKTLKKNKYEQMNEYMNF